MRLLLIDQSAAYHVNFTKILRLSDVSYEALDVVSDPTEAAQMMARGIHDIYFVDSGLFPGSAWALTRQARDAGIAQPIIILTARDGLEIEIAVEEAGANDYLCKGGFSPQALRRTIRRAGRHAAALRAAREAANALSAAQERCSQAVAALRQSESRFRAYFDHSVECLFHVEVTPDGRFVYDAINPMGLAQTGMTHELVQGRTPAEVWGPDAGGIIAEGLRHAYETGDPYRYERTFMVGARAVVYDILNLPLHNDAGQITGILGSARDITERRRLEASLRQSQKMAALGELASGVAHDFNNLLTGMLGYFEMLRKHVSSKAGEKCIAEGCRGVERGTSLTSRLLTFARPQPASVRSVDMNEVVADMEEMFARTLSNVRIEYRFASALWPAVADRHQAELALLNLAINARDAMPEGGAVAFETRNVFLAGGQPDGLAPGNYVVVDVVDKGQGMAADVLARAFDPFFTTKEAGKGTGLGLSLVHRMVKQLGGGIRMTSKVGKGTSVSLFFPRAYSEGLGPVGPEMLQPCPLASVLVGDLPPARPASRSLLGQGPARSFVGSRRASATTFRIPRRSLPHRGYSYPDAGTRPESFELQG